VDGITAVPAVGGLGGRGCESGCEKERDWGVEGRWYDFQSEEDEVCAGGLGGGG
jgi:hypothetical protein